MLPKFRCYIIAEKRYAPIHEMRFNQDGSIFEIALWAEDWRVYGYSPDAVILEQWIEQVDKNNVEIYVGDKGIANGWGDVVHEIVFVEGGYGTKTPNCGYINDINMFYPSGGCILTITGTIHDEIKE